MPRQSKIRERKHWVLSDKMRAWFIKNGWNTEEQFMVDKMMQADYSLTHHPIPDWILDPEKRKRVQSGELNPHEETQQNSDIAPSQ